MIYGTAIGVLSSFTGDIFPLGVRILQIALGIVLSYGGLQMIRHNVSMFDLVISSSQIDENRFVAAHIYWTNWINTRLPNPEDQRELQKILDKNYPKSKFKTFLGWLILSIGGWLIVTFISSILDWIIQKRLDSLFS